MVTKIYIVDNELALIIIKIKYKFGISKNKVHYFNNLFKDKTSLTLKSTQLFNGYGKYLQ